MRALQANLWKIYIYKFLAEFYLIAPILIPYYIDHGLSSTQVFIIQGAYALFILLLEIPSGYLADVIGRKRTLVIGAAAFPVGIAIYALTHHFFTFILAELILAVGNSMRSGCDSAIIYDTLLQLKQEGFYQKFEGRTFFYTRIGTSVSSILGGLTALASLQLPFLINIGTGALMLPVALALTEPEREKIKSRTPMRNIFEIVGWSFLNRRLRPVILYGALIMSTGIIGIWGYFLYYTSLDISVGFFGVLFAAFQLSSAVGSRFAHTVISRTGERTALFAPMLIAPSFLLLGLFPSVYLFPLIFLNACLWGFSFPLLMDSMNRLITSEIRATVLSVANMSGSLLYVLLAPLFGKLTDALSISSAFVLLGIFFLLSGSGILIRIQHEFFSPGESTGGSSRK